MADSGADYGALLGLLGAATISAAGSLYANRQNRKMQEGVNDTAINLANTAHQREVEDLRAAGLNPILSASGSGAPVPSLGVANQDNVLASFGSSSRGIGEMLSKQRALSNESLELDNQSVALDNDITKKRFEAFVPELNSALNLGELKQQATFDYLWGKGNWFIDDDGDLYHTPQFKKGALKDMYDSIEADVKESGTRYLQGWINTGRSVVDTGISGASALSRHRAASESLKHGADRIHNDTYFRGREDTRRQERHDAWKNGRRKK